MRELEKMWELWRKDDLVWDVSKLVAIRFVIKKLQINLVVEDNISLLFCSSREVVFNLF